MRTLLLGLVLLSTLCFRGNHAQDVLGFLAKFFDGPPQSQDKSYSRCTTVSGASAKKPCIFPFKFNGVVYSECTWVSSHLTEHKPWCSTRVDETGHHIKGQWGNCGTGCSNTDSFIKPNNQPPSQPKDSECDEVFQRRGYDYDNILLIGREEELHEPKYGNHFEVLVKGPSDANILLTDGCGCDPEQDYCSAEDCDGYEIVLGAHNNMKSVIREKKLENYPLIDTPNILSSTEWRRFWIRMYTQDRELTIEVGGQFGDSWTRKSFMKRTWSIESIPHTFLKPKYEAFSTTWNDRSLSFCKPADMIFVEPVASFAITIRPPDYGAIPEQKNCSPESLCGYEEGDCGVQGDQGCDDGYVCGVNNCGTIVIGSVGSCCVQYESSRYMLFDQTENELLKESYLKESYTKSISRIEDSEAVPGGYSEWGPWVGDGGWERVRRRIFWPRPGCKFGPEMICGTKWYETEEQSLS